MIEIIVKVILLIYFINLVVACFLGLKYFWGEIRPMTKKEKELIAKRQRGLQEKEFVRDGKLLFHNKDYMKEQAKRAIEERKTKYSQGDIISSNNIVSLFEASLNGDIYAIMEYAKTAIEMGEYVECIQILCQVKDSKVKDISWLQEKNRVCGIAYKGLGYISEAIKYLKNAVELGDREAGDMLIDCVEESDDKNVDIKLMTSLENQGNAKASYYMGKMYLQGSGVIESKMHAINLFYKTLDNSDADELIRAKTKYYLWKMGEKDSHGNKITKNSFKTVLRQGEKQGDRECIEICKKLYSNVLYKGENKWGIMRD